MRRFARELAIGARLTLEGGRESLARIAMTAVGVGLGVVVLLGAIAAMAGAGAGVVLLVTVLTLPALWRLMRPEGLRTE